MKKDDNDDEGMGIAGWVLVVLAVIIFLVSLYARVKLVGFFGFEL
jgi:hypothetical protein